VDKIRYYSSFLMIAVYLGLGLLFFFTDIASNTFPTYRKELGVTMLVYSIVRSGLMIRKYRKGREDER
jgi:hypothetical protein